MQTNRFLFLALLTFALTFAGCDSNDDSDDAEAALEAMSEMMASSFSSLGLVAAEIFTGSFSKSQPTYTCPTTGSIEFDQSPTSSDIYVLDFMDCDGTNGTINLGLGVESSQSLFSFNLLLDGNLENQCTLSFSNFTESVVSDITAGTQSIVIDGAIAASCSGHNYACSFNQSELTITEDTDDYTLFQNSCALTN